MIVPPLGRRREIDRDLSDFFDNHRLPAFNRAIARFCRYFNVKRPKVEWFEYIDWGKTAGKTWEDGRIHLVHPENWKRGRVYYSERLWIQMIYHELGHYLFWTDAERKADAFSRAMVRGLRSAAYRLASVGSGGATSARSGSRSGRVLSGRTRTRVAGRKSRARASSRGRRVRS